LHLVYKRQICLSEEQNKQRRQIINLNIKLKKSASNTANLLKYFKKKRKKTDNLSNCKQDYPSKLKQDNLSTFKAKEL